MNFLRLRRTPKLAVPQRDTDIFFVDDDGVFKKMAPDGTVSEVGSGGGGGGGIAQGGPLTADLDVDGHELVDVPTGTFLKLGGAGQVTLETIRDILIHGTEEDINLTADLGDINITTDAVNGGNVELSAGSGLQLTSQGSAGVGDVHVSAQTGFVDVQAAEYVQFEPGFGAGIVALQADGSSWWQLSEPADGDLSAGTFAFWLDATNGAAKFKVKAKTLDGTVVTGQIALS
jgi:hypothetical protein